MAAWDKALTAISEGTGASLWTLVFIVVGTGVGLLVLSFALYWWLVKKRWNLKAEIKLTRSGGKLTNAEWGKAYFNAKRGVCFVKRPGRMQKAIPVRIFDIRKYIQGDDTVTFIQIASDNLIPVLNSSYEEYEEDEPMRDKKTGEIILGDDGEPVYEKAAIMTIKVDPGTNKAWRAAWAEAAKQAYSLKSFFTQFQTPIAIAIVIIAVFVGFAMVWTRLGSICG